MILGAVVGGILVNGMMTVTFLGSLPLSPKEKRLIMVLNKQRWLRQDVNVAASCIQAAWRWRASRQSPNPRIAANDLEMACYDAINNFRWVRQREPLDPDLQEHKRQERHRGSRRWSTTKAALFENDFTHKLQHLSAMSDAAAEALRNLAAESSSGQVDRL